MKINVRPLRVSRMCLLPDGGRPAGAAQSRTAARVTRAGRNHSSSMSCYPAARRDDCAACPRQRFSASFISCPPALPPPARLACVPLFWSPDHPLRASLREGARPEIKLMTERAVEEARLGDGGVSWRETRAILAHAR